MTAHPGPAGTAAPPPNAADPVVGALLARCTFPRPARPGATADLAVAVSGGADSTALLALAVAAGLQVTAHHVDHGLRPGGEREAEGVAHLANAWGAGFVGHRLVVADGPNLEERCRRARIDVLPSGVLSGHTADDQAETVVLRLLRGTGPAGLAAMERRTHPLLDLRRRDTVALCRHLGVEPFVDPTNSESRFTRNRVRAEVLPLLDDVAGRDVVPLLARLAELAAEQSALLAGLARSVDPTDPRALAAVPSPVAREALRQWWRTRTGGLPPPDSAATDRMVDVVMGESRACDVTAGWRLARSEGRLRLAGPEPRAGHPVPPPPVPMSGAVDAGRRQ